MIADLNIFCDLEGVLVPEMWPHAARTLGVPALARTTREIPDYGTLVAERIALLRHHGITLVDLCRAIGDMAPYAGASAFLDSLRAYGHVTVVTDSFAPMNSALLAQLAVENVLGHRFEVDGDGFIDTCVYWNNLAGKHLCLAELGGSSFAIGDAFNDLTMLHMATCGILFRPSPETALAAQSLVIASDYHEILRELDLLASAVTANSRGMRRARPDRKQAVSSRCNPPRPRMFNGL